MRIAARRSNDGSPRGGSAGSGTTVAWRAAPLSTLSDGSLGCKGLLATRWMVFLECQAYGLGHACQREGRFDRLQRRAATLNLKLGGEAWRNWDNNRTSRSGCARTPMSGRLQNGRRWSKTRMRNTL